MCVCYRKTIGWSTPNVLAASCVIVHADGAIVLRRLGEKAICKTMEQSVAQYRKDFSLTGVCIRHFNYARMY